LERALAAPDDVLAAATDDAWLVERRGGSVRIVAAPRENMKITTPDDLQVAELALRARGVDEARR
jgi:2-C-methyl-D-erythritol 4-phosphate cytidylyltransferase